MLFQVLISLQDQGAIWQLVKMMASIGFWAGLRIVARLVLTFFGVGAADVLASLIATVATFIYTVSQRPAACDPLPTVAVAGIQFNHNPTSISGDAFALRKDYTTVITVPEWVGGKTNPADSPAAYSIADIGANAVTIKVKFTISTKANTTLQIKASGGGVLGAINPVTITFVNGVSSPEYVSVTLANQTIAAAGVHREDITWSWMFLSGSTWNVIGTTAHRIYSVLARPSLPWNPSVTGDLSQQPWTSLLDYVCTWANGTKTAIDAATAITAKVNSGIGLTYDTASGASQYTTTTAPQAFYATDFVSKLAGGAGRGSVVNCTDCATIVTTTANLVGCDLSASTMKGNDGKGFLCNEIIAIGGSGWAYPFPPGNAFSYHEVAYQGQTGLTGIVYDACLQLDSSSDPWTWPGGTHTAKLPTNIPFTTTAILLIPVPIPTPFTDWVYQERLAQNSTAGIGHCYPQGPWPWASGGRRPVI